MALCGRKAAMRTKPKSLRPQYRPQQNPYATTLCAIADDADAKNGLKFFFAVFSLREPFFRGPSFSLPLSF